MTDPTTTLRKRCLGPPMAGIGTASFLAEVGHELPTALLAGRAAADRRPGPAVPARTAPARLAWPACRGRHRHRPVGHPGLLAALARLSAIRPTSRARGRQPLRLPVRPVRVVVADAEVQVHPDALPLDLLDLALAVVLAAGLQGEQLHLPREH